MAEKQTEWVGLGEAAQILGISYGALRRAVLEGTLDNRITHRTVGSREVFYRADLVLSAPPATESAD